MSATLDRIAETLEDARSARVSQAEALRQLAQLAEARGDRTGRRGAGAFFTADDVAAWLVHRAIAPHLLVTAGMDRAEVDGLLATGGSLMPRVADQARDATRRTAMRIRLATLSIVDPTCGAGAFLVAAWRELQQLQDLLDQCEGVRAVRGEQAERPDPTDQPRVAATQLVGIDIDAEAVAACRASLELVTGTDDANILVDDALTGDLITHTAPDVLVGNPPYLRARPEEAPVASTCAAAGNLAAWIVERALAQAAPGARCGFVLPVAVACSDAWSGLRARWSDRCAAVWASHFDTIPATLFPGVVQRLTMLEGRVRDTSGGHGAASGDDAAAWSTTRYHRWTREERSGLLERVSFVPLPRVDLVPGSIAKVGSDLEAGLLARIARHPAAARLIRRGNGALARDVIGHDRLYYKRRWSYFLLFTDFVPPIWGADGAARAPSECKMLAVVEGFDARALVAIYSSSLFWWYFSVFTDNRNVNRRELEGFPVPQLDPTTSALLAELGAELMVALHACAEERVCTYRSIGTIRNTYYRQGATRPVIDRIDHALGAAYGMSREELAFVVGFERRFRS